MTQTSSSAGSKVQGGKSGGGCCGGKAREPLTAMTLDQLKAMEIVPLIMRYRRGIENFDRRVFQLSERQIDQAFLPDANVGRWPVRVLVGHVADAEVAAVHRMRRAVAEEKPVLALWDEDAFVDANLYGNVHEGYADTPESDESRVMHALGGFMAVIHTLRQWNGQWLLSLSPQQLDRVAMHPQRGAERVRDMIAMNTWHLEHHAAFLTRKLDRMLGPAPAEPAAAEGCCGGSGGGSGGCGCG